MTNSKQLTLDEVGEIEREPWCHSYGDDRLEAPLESRRVAITVGQRDALCATVRHLMAEVAEFENTDLVPRSRYNAADAEAREAREMVKTIADRAKAEIERLEAKVVGYKKLYGPRAGNETELDLET